jgi:hypothetical protein
MAVGVKERGGGFVPDRLVGASMNEFPVDGLFDRLKPRGAHPDRVCFSGRSRPGKGDF